MTDSMEVIDIIDQEDGGAIVKFDMSEKVTNALIRAGIQDMLNEHGHKYMVIPHSEWEEWKDLNEGEVPTPRTYDMSDEESQAFLQIGVLNAIKRGIEETLGSEQAKQLEFDFSEDELQNGC